MADFTNVNTNSEEPAVSSGATIDNTITASSSSSEPENASATSSESAVPSASSNADKDSSAAELATLPTHDRGTFEPVNDRAANVTFLERNGDKLSVQLSAPSLADVEEIGDTRFDFHADDNGEQITNINTKRFHEALFKHVIGTITVTPADGGDRSFSQATWDFFDKHREAYSYIIGKAATFYTAD